MKLEQFIDLVKAPERVGEEHISSIEKIISEYPYFQTAHLLYAKALSNSNHINYRNTLKKTAVVAGSRTVLYRLMQLADLSVKIALTKLEEVKPIIEKVEKISNVSITYDVIANIKTEEKSKIISSEVEKPAIFIREAEKLESLEEVILKPVIEAYVETEILKINEKETVETFERSFTDWLIAVAEKTPLIEIAEKTREKAEEQSSAKASEEGPKLKTKDEKQQIFDKFVNENVKIGRREKDWDFTSVAEKSKGSNIQNEDLITETLAKIYLAQKEHKKAMRAYEILSLKFPEKSAYFATLSQEIKNSLK